MYNVPKMISNKSTKIQMQPPIDNALNIELKAVLNAQSKCYVFSLSVVLTAKSSI